MTFKIDKVGFYKNRKGERIHVYRCPTSGVWKDSDNRVYCQYGFYAPDYDCSIIAHWEEPLELGEFTQIKDLDEDGNERGKFWLVWNEVNCHLDVYDSLLEAKEDAINCAKNNKGRTFYVAEALLGYTAEVEIKEVKI